MTEDAISKTDEVSKQADQKWVIPDDEEHSVYRFVLAAARRARQLQGGQRPAIKTSLRKPTKIAMEEIRCGSVRVEVVPEGQPILPEDDGIGAPGQDELDAWLAPGGAAGEGPWKPSGGPRPPRVAPGPWPPRR